MAGPVREEVREAFALQAVHCDDLGSPFTAQLCRTFSRHLDDGTVVGRLVNEWHGRVSHRADAVPLRLCGGFHSLVLRRRDEELAAHYPPRSMTPPDWPILKGALERHADFLLDWMQSPPQTNEVRRANAIWPVLQWIVGRTGKPLELWEIGASAGLNLQMDRYFFDHGGDTSGVAGNAVRLVPEWRGAPPPGGTPVIAGKAGCDINPLDPTDDDDRLRLLSYLWPDQTDRLARTRAAIDLAAAHPVALQKLDAVSFLKTMLPKRSKQAATVIYTTIAWQYLSEDDKQAAESLIGRHGQDADKDAPLARVHMEGDGNAPGAAITVQLWPDGIEKLAGRVDFHGRWVDWHEPGD